MRTIIVDNGDCKCGCAPKPAELFKANTEHYRPGSARGEAEWTPGEYDPTGLLRSREN